MLISCAHLLPAPLHQQVDRIWGQAGLQEPQAFVQGLHHLSISAVLIGKTSLVVHLPHEHAWAGVNKESPIVIEYAKPL